MTDITRPRRYVLAGGPDPKPSIALAVLGTMLEEAENDLHYLQEVKEGPTTIAIARGIVGALRRARNRVGDAEIDAEAER